MLNKDITVQGNLYPNMRNYELRKQKIERNMFFFKENVKTENVRLRCVLIMCLAHR